MTNVKTVKAPDYSSVADIKNPPEVKQLLDALHQEQISLEKLKEEIPTQLQAAIRTTETSIQEITTQIKEAIEKHGSYQDRDAGLYGVKYKRISVSYLVEPFKKRYPKYIPAVVIETINVEALKGLIKGELITEAELKMPPKVIVETPAYAFYIR